MLPGSHTGHEELCERLQWTGGDFVPLPGGDPLLELPPKLVVAKAGDLILWDSEWTVLPRGRLDPPLPCSHAKTCSGKLSRAAALSGLLRRRRSSNRSKSARASSFFFSTRLRREVPRYRRACPAGRTVHCNGPATKPLGAPRLDSDGGVDFLRAVAYVCIWAPEFGGRRWVLRVRDWPSQNGVFGSH